MPVFFWTPQPAQARERAIPALVPAHFEDSGAGDANFNLIAFLEAKGLDDR